MCFDSFIYVVIMCAARFTSNSSVCRSHLFTYIDIIAHADALRSRTIAWESPSLYFTNISNIFSAESS